MAKLRVKEICKEKGISLKVLSEKMGITPSALSQCLSSPNPSIQSLERIAKTLRVNLSELFDKDYGVINGFVEVNNTIYSISSREQWLNVSDKIDGLVHIPSFTLADGHREAISQFVKSRIKDNERKAMMARLGTGEVFSLGYDNNERTFHLTLCIGEGEVSYFQYYVIAYGESKPDVDAMISEIIAVVENVYDDVEYGEGI